MRIKLANIFIGVVIAALIFLGCVWYSPLLLISSFLSGSQVTAGSYELSLRLLGSAFTDVPVPDMLYFSCISILIGANVALTIEYLQRRRRDVRNLSGVVGVFGTLAAILGFGCAACGSLLAGWAFGAFGLGWLLTLLPFGGEELRLAGIALLLLSAYLTIRNLRNPSVCPI